MTFKIIQGGAKPVEELEREALTDLHEAAQRYHGELKAAASPIARYVRSVAHSTEDLLESRR